jgi:nucleoid-associated protein YgaU
MVAQLGNRRKYRVTLGIGSNVASLAVGAAAAAAIVVGAAVLVPQFAPEQVDEAAELVADVPAVEVEVLNTDVAKSVVSKAAETLLTVAPVREEFLMFSDGFATIAGKAAPGATVEVIVAGESMERVVADANGNFGATLFIEPSDQPRVMRLIADPDGAAVPSAETYFVQPSVVAVAAATPELPTADADVETVAAAVSEETSTADAVVAEVGEATDNVTEADETVEIAAVVDDVSVAVEDTVTEAAGDVSADVADEASEAAEIVAEVTEAVADTDEVVAVVDPIAPEPNDTEVVADTEVAQVEEPTATEEKATQEVVADASEPTSPAVLVADADGVRVLQPALSDQSPEVMSNVALDTITYDEAGEVLIAGRALGQGSVQVYLDNQPITTTLINEQGDWRTDLPDVDTGVYTLRIDEVSAEGDVVSRIETPFQREEPEDVAAVFAEEVKDDAFEVAVRTVQPGSTLWAIAREEFGEGVMYVAVFEANKDRIRNPDLIYPGQVFLIPEVTE